MIDFDYNATTPVKEDVRAAMQPFLNDDYGNPSSVHRVGQPPKAAVEKAREKISNQVNCDPESLTITASGSEANTLAIRGLVRPPYEEKTIVTTQIEHSCVKDTCEWMEQRGATIHRAPVLRNGQVSVDWFRETVDDRVDLVSVMTVNNETGVMLPTDEIGAICEESEVLFHSDAVQALGKIPLDYESSPVDLMSISAHKIGGPKGSGALIAPRSVKLTPLVFGGHQERDRRGGTENVPSLVGFSEAISRISPSVFQRTAEIRDELQSELRQSIDDLYVVSADAKRVGNTLGILIRGVKGEDVVMRLDMKGIAVATGSACTSGSTQPSHVIKSIPLPETYNPESFVRISLPPHPEPQHIDRFLSEIQDCVDTLRHKSFV